MSLLCMCPTRGRPGAALHFARSVVHTSSADVAFYVDMDQLDHYAALPQMGERVKVEFGPQIGSAQSYNALFERFPGYDVYGVCADDCEFRINAWDQYIEQKIAGWPGRIGVVGSTSPDVPHIQFPFVSRQWIEALGYVVPPGFKHYTIDTVIQLLGQFTNLDFAPLEELNLHHFSEPQGDAEVVKDDAIEFLLWVARESRGAVEKLRAAR